jgi:hypothetical protein
VNDVAIVNAGTAPSRSPSVDKALRKLAQMPLTEACVSGLCDMCLFQTGLCNMVGQHWADSQPSRRSGE